MNEMFKCYGDNLAKIQDWHVFVAAVGKTSLQNDPPHGQPNKQGS